MVKRSPVTVGSEQTAGSEQLDLVIRGGEIFDGLRSPRRRADMGIKDGRVVVISQTPLPPAREEIDATGKWVTPGFIDLHTHYDAEVEVAPALFESVRQGITPVFFGSCSLGASLGSPEDICDIFCRVEGIPRDIMLPIMQQRKNWETLAEYRDHLDALPLGPNVASFVGHSNLRMHVMGFDRSVQPGERATAEELAQMEAMLEEGLDLGYLGLSVQTLPWDKLDGDRWAARPLPSYYAPWSEYRRLTRILRRRDRVFQGVPNITTKVNVLLFLLESTGLFRKPLRTTIISLMDVIADRMVIKIIPPLLRLFNGLLRADFRMQALPHLFDVWSDGMDLVIFEEFGAGTEAINVADLGARAELLRDPAYRKRFRKQWTAVFSPKVYHRNFRYTEIRGCPDEKLVGRSFAEIAAEQSRHEVDVFLDLCAEYGDQLRWYTAVANDRPRQLAQIVNNPDVLIGFSDAGAHLRNMALYNFPLRLLRLARDAERRGDRDFLSVEEAVWRVSGEIAEWFHLDVGVLEPGRRADVVVVNPEGLTDVVDETHEEEMQGFNGLRRLVRRNPGVVSEVVIGGRVASRDGVADPALGVERGFGRFLRPG